MSIPNHRRKQKRSLPDHIHYAIPGGGFIRDYVNYASKCTDAPRRYHIGCAVSIVSAVIAGEVRLVSNKASSALNLWCLITGRSSLERKSFCIRLATHLLEQIVPNRIAPISGSVEGLFEHLVEEPCSIFVAPELASLLDQMEASYWKQGRTLLMDLYDARDSYVRKLRGREPIVIEQPKISLLAAASLPYLEQVGRSVDWKGGFLARFLILNSTRPKDRFMAEPKERPSERDQLVEELHRISSFSKRKIEITPDARRIFVHFSQQVDDLAQRSPEYLHGPICRVVDHVKRAAGIYAYTWNTDLGGHHMRQAVNLGRLSLESIKAVGDEVARDPVVKLRTRILAMLTKKPHGMFRSQLVRNSNVMSRQLDPILETLLDEEAICVESVGRKRLYVLAHVVDKRRKPPKVRGTSRGAEKSPFVDDDDTSVNPKDLN